MDRTNAPGSVAGLHVEKNQLANPPVPGTTIAARVLNGFQEELAHVIEQAGLTLDALDNTQLLEAFAIHVTAFTSREWTITAPSNVIAGQVILVGAKPVVCRDAATAGNPVVVYTFGVFTVTKNSADTWVQGANLWWDDAAHVPTRTAGTNRLLGWAWGAGVNGQTTTQIYLMPFAGPQGLS